MALVHVQYIHVYICTLYNVHKFSTAYVTFLLLPPPPEAGQCSPREMDESEATCNLFMAGELSQLSPAHTSPHLSLLVQLILLATSEGGETHTELCTTGG